VLVDEFLPVYDISDAVATVVEADVSTTWNALMDVDLIDVGRRRPIVAALGALRMLPEVVMRLLHGEAAPEAPRQLRLRDMPTLPPEQGGWILLGERPRDEVALGLVGKFWLPVIEYAKVAPESFRSFNEPGYARTIYALSVFGGGSLIAGALSSQAGHFAQNLTGAASGAGVQFTYETDARQLWWDADGIGGVAGVVVASFSAGTPALTASDIVLL